MEELQCVKDLSKNIKCRDSLIRNLYSLLADDTELFQSLFIYGHVSTGKSYIIQNLLEWLDYNYCIVNCIEHASNRSMFEKIITNLLVLKLEKSNGYKIDQRCENFMEFVNRLKTDDIQEPIVIVFEKCEKLRDMDANLFPALLRLKELTNKNICTIFSTDICWDKFTPITGVCEPIKIFFPQYTQEEIVELLTLSRPEKYPEEFYQIYLNIFLRVYYRFCVDLNELRYMARKNFAQFVEPVESGLTKIDDTSSLWRNSHNYLKRNLEVIYLRMSTDDFNKGSDLSHEIESTSKLALSFELPFYAKYILIAAFLASYNPPSEDTRIFMKNTGPKKKRPKKKIMKRQTMLTMSGPKSFPLRRLLAIFCSIIDSKVDLNAILLTQVPAMCQLGLLTMYGGNNIDDPKYKCCVSLLFAESIAKNVDFELRKYLHDFIF